MRRWVGIGLLGLLLWLGPGCSRAPVPAARPAVLLLRFKGPITPVTVHYLKRGIRQGRAAHVEALIFQMDTPGGSITAMREAIREIRNSPVPVVVYVAPRGATASSAGSLLLLAAHVAAMAPETTLGAAAPVGPSGQDLGKTLKTKTVNILRAMARTLARERGPQAVDMAQRLVTEAQALTAEEALNIGLIDIIAEDVDALLARLDGWRVQTADGERVLHTATALRLDMPMSMLEDVLLLLSDPNVVFLLLALGIQLLLVEISHPGGWVAGFLGALMVALSLYGLGMLPVNWLGLLFIVLAFVLFILELKTPGWQGGLIVAGGFSLAIGALLLFNSLPDAPSYARVSVPLVLATATLFSLVAGTILYLAMRAQQKPTVTGPEYLQSTLVGRRALVRSRITPVEPGTVHVAGELWTAELLPGARAVEPMEWVEVVEVRGGHLVVRPVETPAQAAVESNHGPAA